MGINLRAVRFSEGRTSAGSTQQETENLGAATTTGPVGGLWPPKALSRLRHHSFRSPGSD